MGALDELIRKGKVLYAGCSNIASGEIARAQQAAKGMNLLGFVSCQGGYNLLAREAERELMPELRRQGVSFLPFAPLAGGC